MLFPMKATKCFSMNYFGLHQLKYEENTRKVLHVNPLIKCLLDVLLQIKLPGLWQK